MPKKHSTTPLLPIFVICAVIVGGLFFLFKPRQEIPVTPASPSQETMRLSPDEDKEKPQQTDNINGNLASQSSDEQGPLLRLAPMEAVLNNPCFEASQKLDHFFTYLDDQEYIQKYQFPHDSKVLISNLINTLLKSPPVINGKTLSSSDIIRNSAHIYRTLGPQNLTILYKIIKNEADLMEETCSSFHEWFNISTQCLNHPYPLRPSLESLYEYASFFLETTGGKAYLARREGNLRLLAQYYSVLIIHHADQRGLNKYNIKLTPLLPLLIKEIEDSDELADKKSYLASLYDIREQLSGHPG